MHLSARWNRLLACSLGVLTSTTAFGAAVAEGAQPEAGGMWLFLEYAWEQGSKFGWGEIGVHLLIAAILSLLLVWPIGTKIVGRRKILIRAALFVGSIVTLSAAFLALGYFVLRSQSFVMLGALVVLFLGIVFAQTRHLFGASRTAAAVLLGCYVILAAGASYGTEFLTGRMPWTEFVTRAGEEQRRLFADWESGRREKTASTATVATPATPPAATAPAASPVTTGAPLASAGSQEIPTTRPAPAAPPAPPVAAPDLAALYAQLQKTRAELDTKDPVAVARFNEQAAAYQQEKAIAAALSAPKAQPVQARPSTSTALERTRANSPTAKPAKN